MHWNVFQTTMQAAKDGIEAGGPITEETRVALRKAVVDICLDLLRSTCGRDDPHQAKRFRYFYVELGQHGLMSIWTEALDALHGILKDHEEKPDSHALGLAMAYMCVKDIHNKRKRRAAKDSMKSNSTSQLSEPAHASVKHDDRDDEDDYGSLYSASISLCPFGDGTKDSSQAESDNP